VAGAQPTRRNWPYADMRGDQNAPQVGGMMGDVRTYEVVVRMRGDIHRFSYDL